MARLLRIDKLLKLLKAKGKPELVSIDFRDTVDHAIELMMDRDFSQLPVRKDGEIIGIISFESIVKKMFRIEKEKESQKSIDLLRCKVEKLMEKPLIRKCFEDLFGLLDTLAEKSFIQTRTEDGKDEIITNYDVLTYFRELTEPFLVINDIEDCLRQMISAKFDESSFKEKAMVLSKCQKKRSKTPERVDQLDFGGYRTFICSYWEAFCDLLEDKSVFLRRLEEARRIRNDICHFRGLIAESDKENLKEVLEWFESRSSVYSNAQ